MTYIFIYFIPGAAGNFFSRCLNLLDNSFCWTIDQHFPLDLDEKLEILSYQTKKPKDWVQFELSLKHYSEFRQHNQLYDQAKTIWLQHPNYDMIERSLPTDTDQTVIFYINPQKCFDWCISNALYKNTWIDAKWIAAGRDIAQRHDVINLDLYNIKTSWNLFRQEFQLALDAIHHNMSSQEEQGIQTLWNQWQNTILRDDDIADFKTNLGWHPT